MRMLKTGIQAIDKDLKVFILHPDEQTVLPMGAAFFVTSLSDEEIMNLIGKYYLRRKFHDQFFVEESAPAYTYEEMKCYRYHDNDGSAKVGLGIETPAEFLEQYNDLIDIEQLMILNVLPEWIGNLSELISINIGKLLKWQNGYDMKANMTRLVSTRNAKGRNLLIVDMSASMGDIGTFICYLVPTIQKMIHADIIFTGSSSFLYKFEDGIPDPREIRAAIGRGNESGMFKKIVENEMPRPYTNVIAFGDFDAPKGIDIEKVQKAQHIWSFNKDSTEDTCGYCQAFDGIDTKVHYQPKSWVKDLNINGR